jgi:orotidine-5'-phosphate decarboxylase
MNLTFAQRLERAQNKGLLCIGLDPDLAKLPADLKKSPAALLEFNRRIVTATCEFTAAYKPQIAFYSALGAERQLEQSIACIRELAPHALVILDAKRGDIGNTSQAYADEAFERYRADAVTINPYMGSDAIAPFVARSSHGALVLCRTSNAGAGDFQDLVSEGLPLYRHVARRAAQDWNAQRNLMLVVGATFPREMAALRAAHPELCFLVPGIGAQGGDLAATLKAGLDAHGRGVLINSSRGIIYAGGGDATSIRAAALELHSTINAIRSAARSAA